MHINLSKQNMLVLRMIIEQIFQCLRASGLTLINNPIKTYLNILFCI